MSIPFTQYLMPDGRRQNVYIDRPKEIEDLAHRTILCGYVFEAEVLSTGVVSFEVINRESEKVIAGALANNGPEVPETVDKLVREAAKELNL